MQLTVRPFKVGENVEVSPQAENVAKLWRGRQGVITNCCKFNEDDDFFWEVTIDNRGLLFLDSELEGALT